MLKFILTEKGSIDGPVVVTRSNLPNQCERLGRIRGGRSMPDIHPVVRIVSIIHGGVNVEVSVDLMELRGLLIKFSRASGQKSARTDPDVLLTAAGRRPDSRWVHIEICD